ncbi:hypothetical protein SHA02_06310 [Salisediminibacterium halotolerans]|nr:hypothetical protein SHA02_06310 [Salisediminibacterium halotolerans]
MFNLTSVDVTTLSILLRRRCKLPSFFSVFFTVEVIFNKKPNLDLQISSALW